MTAAATRGCPGGSAEPPERPKLALAEPRSGPTPQRTASNATAVSRTDPNAKLRHKPGHRTHLVHRAQVAVDPKARVIVAIEAERATGSEADVLPALIGRARVAGHTAREVCADAGYASLASFAKLEALNSLALIPPQPGATHAAAHAARARMRSPVGRDAAVDRQTHAEGAIAELKHHGLERARCRGTRNTQLQSARRGDRDQPQRLLGAGQARPDGQTGDSGTDRAVITSLLALLDLVLTEIDRLDAVPLTTGRLTATDTSTGS